MYNLLVMITTFSIMPVLFYFIIMFIDFVFLKREKVIYKGRWTLRYSQWTQRQGGDITEYMQLEKNLPITLLKYLWDWRFKLLLLYIFCPNLSGCLWWGTVVQVLQSRMPICIPRVSFDDFYLHGSPDFSGHLTFHLLHVKSQTQLCPPSLSLSSLLYFSLSFLVPSNFFFKKKKDHRFRAGVWEKWEGVRERGKEEVKWRGAFMLQAQSKAELVSCAGVILQGPWQSKRVDDG